MLQEPRALATIGWSRVAIDRQTRPRGPHSSLARSGLDDRKMGCETFQLHAFVRNGRDGDGLSAGFVFTMSADKRPARAQAHWLAITLVRAKLLNVSRAVDAPKDDEPIMAAD
jgi:hypothetical protein